jgi:glycerate kinase
MCSLTDAQLRTVGIARAYALTDIELDLARCRDQAGPLLEDLAERIAHDWITP